MPPTRLVNLLPQLSEATGLKLAAAGEVQDQVVTLHVAKVPTRVLMDKISQACLAQWVEKDGAYILTRSAEERRRLSAADLDARAKAVGSQIAKLKPTEGSFDRQAAAALVQRMRDANDFKPAGDNEHRAKLMRIDNMRDQMPIGQLLIRLIKSLEPAKLVQLPPGFTVFSDRPTRMQRPIPAEGLDAIEAFRSAQAAWAAEVAAMPEGTMSVSSGSQLDPRYWAPPVGRKSAFVLRVWRSVDRVFDTFQFQLRIVEDGKVLMPQLSRQLLVELAPPAPTLAQGLQPLLRDARAVEFDPAVRRLVKSISGMRDHFEPLRVPLDVQERAADPEHHDPLADSAVDGLRSIAKMRGLNMVAWVPDRLFNLTSFLYE
jgi:hypothetical protein